MRKTERGGRLLAAGMLSLTLACGLTAPAASAAEVSQVSQGTGGGAVRLDGNGSPVAPPSNPVSKKEEAPRPGDPSAAAARKSWYYYGPITVKPYEWWDAWVYCPDGTRATGGGAYNSSAGGVTLHNTFALDGGSGWKVRITSTVNATFTVYVVCFSGLSSYYHAVDKIVLQPGWQAERWGECVYGTTVTSGGASADTPYTRLSSLWSTFYDRQWRASMTNLDSVAQTMNTQAICASGINNYQYVIGPTTYMGTGQGLTGSAVVQCPAGTWVVGGGILISGIGSVTDSYPESNDRWRVFFRNDSSQYALNASARVICGT